MFLEADEHIEVARRSATHPGLALAGDAKLLTVVDAGRDRERDLAVLALPAFAPAARADLVDRLAGAPAARARRHVDEPTENRLLHLADLPPPVARRAGRDRRAGLGAGPFASLARLEPRHGDDPLAPFDGVEEVDLDLHAQVRPAHWAARLPAPSVSAEERLEEIADAEIAKAPGRRTEHVVALAALRVGEHFVCLGDLLEPVRGVGRPVHVGVVLAGELAVGAADLLVRRASRDAQKRVVIGCRRHHLSLSRPMDVLLRIGVQWLHVTAGVLWIGGGFYTILVQLPALLATPPAARGAVMPNLVPRQFNYILRVAEITIVTGLLHLFVSGRGQELTRLDTRWSWAILTGIILAVGIYAATPATIVRRAYRMLEGVPRAASGDAGAAAEMGAIGARIRRFGYFQLAVGALILLAMVSARFS